MQKIQVPTLALATMVLFAACAGSPATTDTLELRLLSWNVLHGADEQGRLNLAAKGDWLHEQGACLVFLQEIDQNCARSGSVDQMQEFARATGLAARFGAFMPFQGGHYGLGVLSALPVVASRSIRLPEGDEPRVALALELELLGARLLAVDVHFDWIENDAARFAQAQALLAELARSRLPCIVAGDFNDLPDSRTLAAFHEAGFRHLEPPGNSWNARNPSKDIDHVLLRSGDGLEFTPLGGAVLEEISLSDHRPVLARLGVRRRQ